MERKLGKRIKELRLENKLSMKQLSLDTGISATAICQWENNITDISGDNLIVLAKYFKVSTDYLLGLED